MMPPAFYELLIERMHGNGQAKGLAVLALAASVLKRYRHF